MKQSRRSFLRRTALAGGAVALRGLGGRCQASALPAAASTGAGSRSAMIRELFQSPPAKYRPLVRWWWPGNDVDDAELRREIGVLEKAGFGGAEIQPFVKGLPPQYIDAADMQRVNDYATPSFFRHVGVAADEAIRRGMFIDYTFGSGWPFGGTEITPELASIELRSSHISVEGPAHLRRRLQPPALDDGDASRMPDLLKGLPEGWAERLKQRTQLVAVVAARGTDAEWYFNQLGGRDLWLARTGRLESGTAIDLTAHLEPDGTLNWDVPSGTWQIFVFCSLPTAQRVNAGAGAGPQLVMDHMSARAFAAHARQVGDNAIPFIGQLFGNGLRAIFCDSLEVQANLFWSDDFLSEFHRRRGYDLVPYLPVLKVRSSAEPGDRFDDLPVFDITGIGDQVRGDYRQTVSDLMIERFYEPFNQWARNHNLLSRTQAHGAPAEVLRIYGEASIPETEDLYDNGGYDFLKMAASAAHVYGRPIVGSESFVWSNALYHTTPEKVKLAADELFTAGVNAIVYHGFPYVIPGIPAPGWHPFSGINGSGAYSSQINEANPFWPFIAQLNGYMSRIQTISQAGTNVAAVALYFDDLTHGGVDMPPTPDLNQAIMDAGYNYDHISAASLVKSNPQGPNSRDQALVTAGGASYGVLVLPPLDEIDAALAEKIRDLAASGIPVFFAGRAPSRAMGLLNNAENTQRVAAAIARMRSIGNVYFCRDAADAIARLRDAATPQIRFRTRALPFIQKRIGNMNAFFLRNESDAAEHLDAEFEAEGQPELWNPWTGQTAAVRGFQRDGGWVRITHDLDPFASALIVFDPDIATGAAAAAPAARTLKRTIVIGDDGWKLSAKGLVPTGATATIERKLPALIDWSLDRELRGFSGRGVYSTAFTLPAEDAAKPLTLDLGEVRDVAEVSINGRHAATLLLRPYRVEIAGLVQPGDNRLEIAVTNALFNSMILRNPKPFRAGPTGTPSGLMPAGLIGPVQLAVMADGA
jgi:alpha-L-rhamnosidase